MVTDAWWLPAPMIGVLSVLVGSWQLKLENVPVVISHVWPSS